MQRILTLVALLAGAAPPLASQILTSEVAAGWQADVDYLRGALPHVHPDPFRFVGAARWDSAATAFRAALPEMTPDQAWVGLQNLVALLGDGHTGLNPVVDRVRPLRYYPLDLALLDDTLYVTAAAPPLASAVGARLVAVAGMPAGEALARVAAGVPQENEWWVRAWAPARLTYPEVVRGAGIAADVDPIALTFERDGRRFVLAVRPAGALPRAPHGVGDAIDRTSWSRMAGGRTLSEAHPDRVYWLRWIPETQMLYVNYRAVIDWPGEANADFWTRVFAAADSLPVRRLVLDLRENMGGNNTYNLRVIREIVRRPALDRSDRLYVLIGRRTFSAAMNLVNELERYTEATFVGEPTGSRPNLFGDHAPVTLPNTGLTVMVSTLWWQTMNPRDTRRFVAPRLYAPPTAAAVRAGTDPAIDAVLADTAPPLAHQLRVLASAGDTAAIAALVAAAAVSATNRYATPETALNATGYEALNRGDLPMAVWVFGFNARLFPASANVWDSLGEALVRAGRRTDAVAAFRRALAVDPDYAPSREWLQRLGAQ